MLRLLCAIAASAAAASSPTCASDLDCSLNGVCSAQAVCACDAPWSGPACAELTFAATTPASGKSLYDAGSSAENTWNGPSLTGPDGKIRLYVPLYQKGSLGAPTSTLRGVADAITGPFTWAVQPELPGAENPAAVSFIDPQTGALVFTLWLAGKVFVASEPDGPWKPSGATYPGGNPAPVYYKGAWYMTNQATTEVWTTPRLGAAWTVFSNISHDGLPANDYHVEDPFLWVDSAGRWHIINHAYSNMQFNSCGVSDVSAHWFSPDGRAWTFSRQPYGHTVRYDDGTAHTYTTLERPNLHFNEGRITHITLAADLVTGDEGCANRTRHAHNGHTPCDNCKWDDLAGTTVIALASS